MEIFTQYPAEWLYLWLIVQTVWVIKLPARPLPLVGFAFSHGLLLVMLWFCRADMPYLVNYRPNQQLSSFWLILFLWAAGAVYYACQIALLKNPKRRQKRIR